MGIALFDLDNTLIAGDSDYLWGVFLAEQGIVDGASHERKNRRFYDQYKAGELDIHEFLEFQLQPLAANSIEKLKQLRERYLQKMITPILLTAAQQLVDKHRNQDDTLVVITATNSFITEPIVAMYGIPHLLATEPELVDGAYTGAVSGVPCFQAGKVEKLSGWLAQNNESLDESWFYSDSHNDLPLLGEVTHPVAVDPDEILEQHAKHHGWPIISLR